MLAEDLSHSPPSTDSLRLDVGLTDIGFWHERSLLTKIPTRCAYFLLNTDGANTMDETGLAVSMASPTMVVFF